MELGQEDTGEFLLVRVAESDRTRRLSFYEFLRLYDRCLLIMLGSFCVLVFGFLLCFLIFALRMHHQT